MFKKTPEFDKFEKFVAAHLGIKKLPEIQYVGHEEDAKKAFGDFTQHDNKVTVRTIDRHPIDVMRTLAHELAHYKWKLEGKTGDNKPGGASENYAHEKAGEIMRKYDATHGFMFKAKPLKEDGIASAPVNAMGGSSSTSGTGGIDTFDPLLKKPKKLRVILSRKTLEDAHGASK